MKIIINAYSMKWRIFLGAGRTFSINAILVGHSSQHSFLPGALPGHFFTFSTALPCSLGLTTSKRIHLSDCSSRSYDVGSIVTDSWPSYVIITQENV